MVTVCGHVTDINSGEPVENATVVIAGKFALSNEEGYFCMYDIPTGTHNLHVLQRFYKKFLQPVEIQGDSTISVTMQRG